MFQPFELRNFCKRNTMHVCRSTCHLHAYRDMHLCSAGFPKNSSELCWSDVRRWHESRSTDSFCSGTPPSRRSIAPQKNGFGYDNEKWKGFPMNKIPRTQVSSKTIILLMLRHKVVVPTTSGQRKPPLIHILTGESVASVLARFVTYYTLSPASLMFYTRLRKFAHTRD